MLRPVPRDRAIVPQPGREHITELLSHAQAGDKSALKRVFPIVYEELRRLASAILAREPAGHTLQPTALVHEVYLKLLKQDTAGFAHRAQFLGVAAQAMRRILVDHVRTKKRDKRGGRHQQLLLEDAVAVFEERAHDLLALDDALTRLKGIDERKATIVELRFFAGLDTRDVAEVLGVSLRTCERDWTLARAWLHRELAG